MNVLLHCSTSKPVLPRCLELARRLSSVSKTGLGQLSPPWQSSQACIPLCCLLPTLESSELLSLLSQSLSSLSPSSLALSSVGLRQLASDEPHDEPPSLTTTSLSISCNPNSSQMACPDLCSQLVFPQVAVLALHPGLPLYLLVHYPLCPRVMGPTGCGLRHQTVSSPHDSWHRSVCASLPREPTHLYLCHFSHLRVKPKNTSSESVTICSGTPSCLCCKACNPLILPW